MENFFWKLSFFQGKNGRQKQRLGSETLELSFDPSFRPSQPEDVHRLPWDRSPREVQEASPPPHPATEALSLWLPCHHLP